jgi:hypothetical protein
MNIEELERELRAERPQAETEFTSRLDEWATDGFPHDSGLGPRALGAGAVAGPGALARAWQRLTDLSPRRVLLPVGAVATVLIVVGVAVSQRDSIVPSSGDDSSSAGPESSAGSDSAGAAPQAAESSAGAVDEYNLAPLPEPAGAGAATEKPAPPADSIARGSDGRIVDATARIRLGADRGDVQEVANGVVAVTDRYEGVVRDSEVTTDQGGARASFELEIPYRELDAAIGDISELADVISRTESAEDITAQAVRSQRELARVLEQIRNARIERIEADTHEERLIVDARIDSLEATAEALQSQIDGVRRQGRFATVSVEITSDRPESGSGAGWSISDALDDAGRALELIAGIALVTLAIATPLALVVLLAWLIAARARRMSRERALDA